MAIVEHLRPAAPPLGSEVALEIRGTRNRSELLEGGAEEPVLLVLELGDPPAEEEPRVYLEPAFARSWARKLRTETRFTSPIVRLSLAA